MQFRNPAVNVTRLDSIFVQLQYGVKSFLIMSRTLDSLPPHPQWDLIKEMKYSSAKE